MYFLLTLFLEIAIKKLIYFGNAGFVLYAYYSVLIRCPYAKLVY